MMRETSKAQVDRLASFIIAEIEGEPSRSEGAVDCAIRVMKAQRDELGKSVVDKLADQGQPSSDELDAARWIGPARDLLKTLLRQKTTVGNEQLMRKLIATPWPDRRDWDWMITEPVVQVPPMPEKLVTPGMAGITIKTGDSQG